MKKVVNRDQRDQGNGDQMLVHSGFKHQVRAVDHNLVFEPYVLGFELGIDVRSVDAKVLMEQKLCWCGLMATLTVC